MWTRLHGPSEDGVIAKVVVSDVRHEQAKEEAGGSTTADSSDTQARLTTAPVALRSGILPITKEERTTSPRPIKRSLPPEVSNNNTDDEGGPSAPLPPGDSGVLDISLSLNESHSKRVKLSDEETERSSGTNERKKLQFPAVAV